MKRDLNQCLLWKTIQWKRWVQSIRSDTMISDSFQFTKGENWKWSFCLHSVAVEAFFFTLFTILGTSIRCRLQLLWFNSIINLHRERNIEYRSMVIVYQITSQELSQTSIFCSAFVGSGGGARVLECPSLDEVNPNFSRCSKWLPFLCTSSA